MTRRVYPLNSLRAFEASARHLSFVKAAEELYVTPAAISHQVKKLEEYLGVQLFRRLPRGLLLVETGQVLSSELSEVFLRLDETMARVLESDSRGALTISVAPMFAVKWLVPRLQEFDALHPEIDLRMSSSLGVIDFQRDAFDIAVRLGQGRYPGLEAVKLFDEFVTPLCSPRLLEGPGKILSPEDLSRHVLLHDDSMTFDPAAPNWNMWLEAAGARRVDASRGPHFSQDSFSCLFSDLFCLFSFLLFSLSLSSLLSDFFSCMFFVEVLLSNVIELSSSNSCSCANASLNETDPKLKIK